MTLMPKVAVLVSSLLTVGCAATIIDKPELRQPTAVIGLPNITASELSTTIGTIFEGLNGANVFAFCEASPETSECNQPQEGLSAVGIGGIFLPLIMEVTAMTVDETTSGENVWTLKSEFTSKVNGIPPACAAADGRVTIDSDGVVVIQFDGFFCNWMVIGNVIVTMEMLVDWVDPLTKEFGGNYSLGFNGTGNVAGSGYYRANSGIIQSMDAINIERTTIN